MNHDDDLARLDALARVPPPRRTDAAFARAVADGVKQRRARALLSLPVALPALAATTAALAAVFVVHTTGVHDPVDAGVRVASAGHTVVAAADPIDDELESPFTLPSLDGSSDEELARLDHALDEALKRNP